MLESKYGPGKENIADPNNGQVRTIRLKVGAAKDPSDPRYSSGYRREIASTVPRLCALFQDRPGSIGKQRENSGPEIKHHASHQLRS